MTDTKWIDPTNSLPPDYQYVWASWNGAGNWNHDPKQGLARHIAGMGWQPMHSMGWDWHVTHWMPLPAAPGAEPVMTDTKHSADLPPLPLPSGHDCAWKPSRPFYTADQMESYARAAIAAAAPAGEPVVEDGIRGPLRAQDYQDVMAFARTLGILNDNADAVVRQAASMGYVNGHKDAAPTPAAAPKAALTDKQVNDLAEAAYWNFDARKKGYAEWRGRNQSERDAFKAEFRIAIAAASGPNAALVEALKEVSQCLAWLHQGQCRGFSEKLLPHNEALELARSALAAAGFGVKP